MAQKTDKEIREDVAMGIYNWDDHEAFIKRLPRPEAVQVVHLRIADRPCDECLFSDNKVVDDQRKAEILAECAADDTHFICHKFSIELWKGTLTEDEANVCCNGFYRDDPNASTWMQIAGRLNLIQFVEVPGEDNDDV